MVIRYYTVTLVVVLVFVHLGKTQIPIYEARVENLLKMQHGIGWPTHLRVAKGHEALMRLSRALENMQLCEVVTPAGIRFDVRNPPNDRYQYWSDGCGMRIKNVEDLDNGRWRLTASRNNNSLTGWTAVEVIEDTTSYTPTENIALQDGTAHTEVQLTTLQNSYCLVSQPFSESSLVSGHCRVTLERTTRAVQGRWNVVLGIPGRVTELEVVRNVAVQTEQLVAGFREDSGKLHLYCNLLHTEKNITFCRFQKNSASAGFNIMDGLSNGQHSYYGEGFAKRQCGITIESPSIEDHTTWRCTVGLQEWNNIHIVQSTPMQALIRVIAASNNAIRRQAETDVVRTLFVEKGSSFTLMCRAEYSLAYCWYQHPNGSQYTPVERQNSHERDFWYTGESLQTGDCGITFTHVTENEDGEWTCHMGPKIILGLEVTDKIYVRVTGPLAAEEKELGAYIGGKVVLQCHTANGPRPLDYCRFVTPTSLGIHVDGSVTPENAILNRFYFTPEKNIDHGDCSLTIDPVLLEDSGTWTCAALLHDEVEESMATIALNIERQNLLSNACIAGMVGGIIILAFVLFGTLWYKYGKPIPWRRQTVVADNISLQLNNEVRVASRNSASSSNSNEEPERTAP